MGLRARGAARPSGRAVDQEPPEAATGVRLDAAGALEAVPRDDALAREVPVAAVADDADDEVGAGLDIVCEAASAPTPTVPATARATTPRIRRETESLPASRRGAPERGPVGGVKRGGVMRPR